MKVEFRNYGEVLIEPEPGWDLRRRFVDHETGYLVVVCVQEREGQARKRYTLIDPAAKTVVSRERRRAELDAQARVERDATGRFELTTRRALDPESGLETLHEQVVDLSTGQTVSNRTSIAFDEKPRVSALEESRQRLAATAEYERFWTDEYPRLSPEERARYWIALIYRDMRVMGEVGQDVFSILTRQNYLKWKARDPALDDILPLIRQQLMKMWPGADEEFARFDTMRAVPWEAR